MKLGNVKKIALLMGVAGTLYSPMSAFAAENPAEDVHKENIEAVETVKKDTASAEEMRQKIADLEQQLAEEQESKERFSQILERLERLEMKQASAAPYPAANQSIYLVNPGEGERVSYTQDAANSQGNSTMVFRYAPNQLYKIYCRVGYLTDLTFRKGETISFVGGGDTSAWAVNTSTVDGVPHLYVKPTVDTSTTNLIVTTDKRSYQLILTTSNWYNPMVSWTYGLEDREALRLQKEHDERTLVGTFSGSLESLHFGYKISGNSETKPSVVFDDGQKTVLKFDKLPTRIPALFLKEKGKKGVALANYTVRGNCYILDRVANELELRLSDTETVKIKRKG